MRNLARHFKLSAKIVMNNDSWFLFIAFLLLLIVGGFVHSTYATPQDWRPSSMIGLTEGLGSLLAIFLFTGLLDSETRNGAGEIVFSKPMHPAVTLLFRIVWMLLLLLVMLIGFLLTFRIRFGYAAMAPSLLFAFPSCLFAGMIALTVSQYVRTQISGIAAAICFWIWSFSSGAIYNPALMLTGGSMAAYDRSDSMSMLVWENKAILLLLSAGLFALNAHRLWRYGGESGPRRAIGWRGGFAVFAKGALFVFLYFWSGLLYKTLNFTQYVISQTPSGEDFGENIYGEYERIRQGISSLLRPYGSLNVAPLLGGEIHDYFISMGVGLDNDDPDYSDKVYAAASRLAKSDDVWGQRGKMMLAQLRYYGWNGQKRLSQASVSRNPGIITAILADPNRWRIDRERKTRDPKAGLKACRDILEMNPIPEVGAGVLKLMSTIDKDGWDYKGSLADERELVFKYPSSEYATEIIDKMGIVSADKSEIVSLFRYVRDHQPLMERMSLDQTLASVQASEGDAEGAKETLKLALADWARRPLWKSFPSPNDNDDPESQITKTLSQFRSAANALGNRDAPSGVAVRSRVLADGKPLARAIIGLYPTQREGESYLKHQFQEGWDQARSPGTYVESNRVGIDDSTMIMNFYEFHPALVAETDANGVARWNSVPSGEYVIRLRIDLSESPSASNLSILPTSGAVVIDRSDVTIPDLRLTKPIPLTSFFTKSGVPAIYWKAISGAARYRASLMRIDRPNNLKFHSTERSSGMDSNAVWWKDLTAPGPASISVADLVGSANGENSSGAIIEGLSYAWRVEAFDASGQALAISTGMTPTRFFVARTTIAIPKKAAKGIEIPIESGRTPNADHLPAGRTSDADLPPAGRPPDAPFDPRAMNGRSGGSLDSPFLDNLDAADANPKNRPAPPNTVNPGAFPRPSSVNPEMPPPRFGGVPSRMSKMKTSQVRSLNAVGKGLPPLQPLRIAQTAGLTPGATIPYNLTPGVAPPVIGQGGQLPGQAPIPGAIHLIPNATPVHLPTAPPPIIAMENGVHPGVAIQRIPPTKAPLPAPIYRPRPAPIKSAPDQAPPPMRFDPTAKSRSEKKAESGKSAFSVTTKTEGIMTVITIVNESERPDQVELLSSWSGDATNFASLDIAPKGGAILRLPSSLLPDTAIVKWSGGATLLKK